MNQVSNGRIDIQTPDTRSLFNMYDKIPAHQCSTYRDPLEGQWDNTPMSNAYFSKENIQIIQNGIRNGVHKQSNSQYLIGPQDCDSLKVVMRSVFLQYSANLPGNISNQIQSLNQMVLNYCIQQVYSEAKGYMKYLSDASNMYTPIAHPVLAKENDKELVLKPWF
jgi:hypothetical protein